MIKTLSGKLANFLIIQFPGFVRTKIGHKVMWQIYFLGFGGDKK